MPEYTGRCVKMPKSAWMTFVLYFPCGYIALHIRSYVLKEREVVFLKRQYLIFSMAAGNIFYLLFVLDQIFLQVRFEFAVTFCPGSRDGREF